VAAATAATAVVTAEKAAARRVVAMAAKAVKAAMAVAKAAEPPSRSDGRGRRGIRDVKQRDVREPGRAFQPRPEDQLSEDHSMTPSSATTPFGPEKPQYFTPFTVR